MPNNYSAHLEKGDPSSYYVWYGFLFFSGAMSLTVFKTPLVNFIFWLTFLGLLVKFDCRAFWSRKHLPFERSMLALLAYLCITTIWSGKSLLDDITAVFEYRHLLLIPIFIFYFHRRVSSNLHSLLRVFAILVIVPAIASGLIVSDIINIDGAIRSLSNRIYFGFLISTALAVTLYLFVVDNKALKILWLLTSALFVIAIFVFENGRTGYLQASSVLFFFAYYALQCSDSKIGKALVCAGFLLVMTVMMIFAQERIIESLSNLERFLADGSLASQSGLRLQMLSTSLELLKDKWIFGLGISSVELELMAFSSLNGDIAFDNPHSELINQALIGGLVGVIIYGSLWLSLFYTVFKAKLSMPEHIMWISIFTIFLVGSFFNSSFKDFGEKHLFIVITTIFGLRVNQVLDLKNHGAKYG